MSKAYWLVARRRHGLMATCDKCGWTGPAPFYGVCRQACDIEAIRAGWLLGKGVRRDNCPRCNPHYKGGQ